MRAFCSDIAEAEYGYRLWYLLHYDDILAALQDTATFSSRTIQYLGDSRQKMVPIELDPPEHTPYRQLLSKPLSADNVAKLEDDIRALCVGLVEEQAGKGSCDYLRDFALRFPTRMFLTLMGLPVERTDEYVACAHTMLHTLRDDDPDGARRGAALMTIVSDIGEGIAVKRSQPADDLLSKLVAAKIDGEPIAEDKLLAMGYLLYLAGLDTVANALTYSMRHLAGAPELRHSLTADPSRWPLAIEEFLRYFTLPTPARVVTRDVEFAGCPMKAGDRIVLPLAAADRDPAQFRDANTVVADRNPNRHIAFSAGPHRCVGAHLARLEMRIAMEEWHARIPDYEVAPGAEIKENVGAVAGLSCLPLIWS
jgi:cytochrome P450